MKTEIERKCRRSRQTLPLACNYLLATFVLVAVVSGSVVAANADDHAGAMPDERNEVSQTTQNRDTANEDRPSGPFATEVWLTPLVLLPGVALLIVSTSARFGQLHNEFHRLLDHPDAQGKILAQHLMRRCTLFRDSLVALYASVGLFAFGSLVGGVVNLWRPESLWVVGSATMIGIGCVVYASVQLVREALICLRVLVDYHDALQNITDSQ